MSEVRLIDANALIDTFETKKAKAHDKSIKHLYGQNKNDKLYRKDCETESRCEYVLSVLRTAPTVDAVPVVHAHWRRYSYDEAICTHCGYDRWTEFECSKEADERWGELPMYCENCGARMDGADDV